MASTVVLTVFLLKILTAAASSIDKIRTIENCNGWKQTQAGVYKLTATPTNHYQLCSTKFLAPAGQRIRIKLHHSSLACVPGSFLALYDGWEMTSGRKRTPYFVPAKGPLRTLFICPQQNEIAKLTQAETSQNFAELVYRLMDGESLFAEIQFFDAEHDEPCDVFLTGQDYGKEFTIKLSGEGKKCKWFLPGNILVHVTGVSFDGTHENCSEPGTNHLQTKSGLSWNDLHTWNTLCRPDNVGVYILPCKHSMVELVSASEEQSAVSFWFEPAELRMKILFDQSCLDTHY